MKYLCLAYYDEQAFEALSKSDVEAIEREAHTMDRALIDSGHLVAHGSLQPTLSSTCLRPRRGKVSITDGPFVETKEQVGGFFLIEARDLNEAIRVASQHPAAKMGENVGWGIEVRPIEMYEQF
jgi:hypothetical protein